MRKRSPVRRKRSEADRFRRALAKLRSEQDWNQARLAAVLGVSKRTLSSWECGYWLPPFKQRLHIVLSLRNVPPEHVLEVADALGVSVDPAVGTFLQPFKDDLYGAPPAPEPAPRLPAPLVAPEPPRAAIDPTALRRAFDAVMRDAADGMNVPANELRAAVVRALALGKELAATLDEMKEAVAVREKEKPKGREAP